MTHARNERGAAAVEFALVVPMLMLVLSAIIDFGARYQDVHHLNDAAAVAAREMSISGDVASAKSAGIAAGGPAAGWTISACEPNTNVVVTVTTNHSTVTGVFGAKFNMTARAVARCQK